MMEKIIKVMEKIKEFLTRLPVCALTLICMCAILWLTLASKPLGDNDIQLFPHADKVAHAIMFGGFTFCILLDWSRSHGWRRIAPKTAAAAVAASFLLGALTEFLQQSMHAGRSGDSLDLLADTAGAIATAAAALLMQRHLT